MNETMLISVGGAPAPILFSISHHQPKQIIFFVSITSRKQVVEVIMPQLFKDNNKIIDYEFIVTPDEQDIGESTTILLRDVPKAMNKLNLSATWPEIVDYTGGTKTMSASMVWAASYEKCQFSYIGANAGAARDKKGLGVVLDGYEKCLIQENPWDKLAYISIHEAVLFINNGQYDKAANILETISNKVSAKKEKVIFSTLQNIIQAYALWDQFEHKQAKQLLHDNLPSLSNNVFLDQMMIPNIKTFLKTVKINIEFIDALKPGILSWFMIYDILANALRRAELEHNYTDAAMRTYAAIQKIAKYQLKLKYGIDSDECEIHKLPDTIQKQYKNKIYIQLDTPQSFSLLKKHDDIYAKRFFDIPNILDHIETVKRSVIGNGMATISKKQFEAIFNDAIALLNINSNDLTQFPKL